MHGIDSVHELLRMQSPIRRLFKISEHISHDPSVYASCTDQYADWVAFLTSDGDTP
jgi:hypothetical protein